MNIIFTRPLIDAEDLMTNFFSSNYKVIHLPTLSINSANMEPINTKEFDSLIFIISNAIRFLRLNNTVAASGTVNALKNIILNSEKKIKNLAYLCGDVVSYDLDKDLKLSGFKVKKIINYTSSKITDLNSESLDLIKKYPPDVTLIYSKRSAESFDQIVSKYSLSELMTQCTVMCISKKIKEFLESKGWKKTETFNPGEELLKIEKIKNG